MGSGSHFKHIYNRFGNHVSVCIYMVVQLQLVVRIWPQRPSTAREDTFEQTGPCHIYLMIHLLHVTILYQERARPQTPMPLNPTLATMQLPQVLGSVRRDVLSNAR